MEIVTDACLALLASIGLWAIGRMLIDRILLALENVQITTVVCAAGDCEYLERTIKRFAKKPFRSVILVDCGVTEAGTNTVGFIAEKYTNVSVCSYEEIPIEVKEAKVWTKQENSIK